eukprot:gene8955-904_t
MKTKFVSGIMICFLLLCVVKTEEVFETKEQLLEKYTNSLAKALDVTPFEAINSGEDVSVLINFDSSKKDLGAQIGAKLATKIVTTVVSNVVGSVAGAVLGGFVSVMGFIGDAVQRNKCKLRCCPKHGLPTVWGCKYQTKQNRCEAGMVCRDNTFNAFALFGSVCPKCPKEKAVEPQWRKKALRKAGLPSKFYVSKKEEYLWCAPKGSPGRCKSNRKKSVCEKSYADHHGDKNCIWKNRRCTEDHKCDNSRQRKKEARKLGLRYYRGAWRRNGIAIHYDPYKGYVDHKGNRAGSSKRNVDLLRHDLKRNPAAVIKVPKFKSCIDSCAKATDRKKCALKCTTQYAYFKTGTHSTKRKIIGKRRSSNKRKTIRVRRFRR